MIEWTGATNGVYVEATPALSPAGWTTLAGPISGSGWTLKPETGLPGHFYRLRIE